MANDFFGGGIEAFAARAQKIKAEKDKAARKGLFAAGRLLLNESNSEVPHEEGDFERGGRVSMDDGQLIVAVSYRDTAYKGQSENLHEDMELKHDSGRNAKFLERAMARARDRIRAILGDNIRETMSR